MPTARQRREMAISVRDRARLALSSQGPASASQGRAPAPVLTGATVTGTTWWGPRCPPRVPGPASWSTGPRPWWPALFSGATPRPVRAPWAWGLGRLLGRGHRPLSCPLCLLLCVGGVWGRAAFRRVCPSVDHAEARACLAPRLQAEGRGRSVGTGAGHGERTSSSGCTRCCASHGRCHPQGKPSDALS